ncbi:MAG: DUF805 domain-containing protein [Hyphomicrobiales bacterium]|nr:DUF805 domain-containing protein [Hyphomicrobiales bacterium]MDE2285730.1 DUF805 domain-containing protein [Hyphomicrobiales bacterium]
MGFWPAITSGFSNYVGFSGRASRSEYWYWALFIALAEIATSIIDTALDIQLTKSLFGLATFLPSLAVAVRRLHDLDRNGWWILLSFIPLVGWIILIIWDCTKGTDGPNRFGPDPLRTQVLAQSARA